MTGTAILTAKYANLRIAIEFAFGADLTADESTWTWTDVTPDVLVRDSNLISWTLAQQDESTSDYLATPASANLELDNRSGAYSAYNPLDSGWPNVRKNTPGRIRMSNDAGSTWYVVMQGRCPGFPPSVDQTGTIPTVRVTLVGRLQALQQGTTPLRSAIYRTVSSSAVSLFFPLEDGTSATTAASAVSGRLPYQFNGAVTFGTDAPAGGAGSMDMTNVVANSSIYTVTPTFNVGGNGDSITVAFWVKVTKSSTTWNTPVLTLNTPSSGTVAGWNIAVGDRVGLGTLEVNFLNSSGGAVNSVAAGGSDDPDLADGSWHLCKVKIAQSAATTIDITWQVDSKILNFTGFTPYDLGKVVSVKLGKTNTVLTTNVTQIQIAGLAIWGNVTVPSNLASAGLGFTGETPQTRISRLCSENGVEFTTVGFYDSDISMGPQQVDTLYNNLKAAVEAGGDFLFDGLSDGLTLQGISQRYDQTTALTLNTVTSDFMTPFQPADDDLRTHNKWTVSRVNGSSAVFQKTDGDLGTDTIGVTGESSLTLNVHDDTGLDNRARWNSYFYSIPGFRYPRLFLDLAARPSVGAAWMSRADGFSGPVAPGCRTDITNLRSWSNRLPPETVGLVTVGWSQRINQKQWQIDLVNIPADGYNVFKIEDSQLGRLGTDSSTLTIAANTNDTSLTIGTTDPLPWDTAASGFDILIDGIRVTVSAIASALSDTFGRTVSNGFGNATSGQLYTTSGGSASDYNVGSGVGTILLSTVNASRQVSVGAGWTDMTVSVQFKVPAVATGASLDCGLQIRKVNTSNYYDAELKFNTDQTVVLRFNKNVASSFTTGFATVTLPFTYSAAQVINVKAQCFGTSLMAKAWPSGTVEPGWSLVTTDSGVSASGGVGVRAIAETGNTNTSPTFSIDNLSVLNPQTFTVTGVTKSLAAGKSVKIWKPGVIKL